MPENRFPSTDTKKKRLAIAGAGKEISVFPGEVINPVEKLLSRSLSSYTWDKKGTLCFNLCQLYCLFTGGRFRQIQSLREDNS
jgi:hypothetical protein